MKFYFAALALFAPVSTLAVGPGGGFEIVQNGQKYFCSPENTDPNGTVDCVNKAYSGPFSQPEALRLCAGSFSIAPAECAMKAYAGPFSKEEALHLCTGATDNGSVDCAMAAYTGPFSKEESLQLCAGRSSLATAQCAIRAYAGPYSKQQAIQLCRNVNPSLTSVGLAILHSEATLGFESVLNKAMTKAQTEIR